MEVFVGSIALYNNFKSIVLICINKISTTSLVFNNDKLSAKILVSEHFWFLVTARNTIIVNIKAGKRGGGRGGKIPGARLVWGAQNLDKTSGHCATVKRVGGP